MHITELEDGTPVEKNRSLAKKIEPLYSRENVKVWQDSIQVKSIVTGEMIDIYYINEKFEEHLNTMINLLKRKK